LKDTRAEGCEAQRLNFLREICIVLPCLLRLLRSRVGRHFLVENPAKLGEHLRNRRLLLGLTQERVAFQLSTIREVYELWERDERKPVVSV